MPGGNALAAWIPRWFLAWTHAFRQIRARRQMHLAACTSFCVLVRDYDQCFYGLLRWWQYRLLRSLRWNFVGYLRKFVTRFKKNVYAMYARFHRISDRRGSSNKRSCTVRVSALVWTILVRDNRYKWSRFVRLAVNTVGDRNCLRLQITIV